MLLDLLPLLVATARAAFEEEPVTLDPALLAAEHQRLSGEMEQLARRQAWAGVEQRYEDLVRLGIEPSYEDLVYGAHAARGLGDAQGARDRLKLATQIEATDELKTWLQDLDGGYGHVTLTSCGERPLDLAADALPFAPDARAAVEHAVRLLAREGRFEGLLPVGSYTLAGTGFLVDPGLAVQIEISTRQARQAERDAGRRGGPRTSAEPAPSDEQAAPQPEPEDRSDATLR